MQLSQHETTALRNATFRGYSAVQVEKCWGWAMQARDRRDFDLFRVGMRAARDRSPSLLRALEACTEHIHAVEETQRGQTRRSADGRAGQILTTTSQLVEAAFKAAQAATPETDPEQLQPYGWIYAACCLMADITSSPHYK